MQWDAEVEDGGGPAQTPPPPPAVARAAAERADFGRRPLQPPQPVTAIGGYLAHMRSQVCVLDTRLGDTVAPRIIPRLLGCG